MIKEKKLSIIAKLLLFSATLAWGTSFFILKETITKLPEIYVIGVRFLSSSIIFALIFIKKTVKMDKKTFLHGGIVGIFLAIAYIFQTIGLKNTTPGQNAFITSLYCVMTPFMVWILYKIKPRIYNIVSAVLCVVGIGLISLSSDKTHGSNALLGNGLSFIAAIFFALQLLFIDKFSREKEDSIQFLISEFFVASVVLLLYSAIFEINKYGISAFKIEKKEMISIIYLTLICTLFAQTAQLFGQKYTAPNQAAVILNLEAVFGAIFSMIMGGENMTVLLLLGFIIVFIGTLTSELKPDFAKLIKWRN